MNRIFVCNECGIECKLEISTDSVPSTPRACSYPGECAKKSVWKEVQQSVVIYDGGKFTIPGWKYPIVVNLEHLAIKEDVPLYCGSMIVGKYHAKIENGKLCILGDFEPLVADGLFTMCVDNTETSLCREPFSINGQEFVPTDEEPIYCVSYATLLNVRVVCRVNVKKIEKVKPLPDWCKVGAWVWDNSKKRYDKIQEIKTISSGCWFVHFEFEQIHGEQFFRDIKPALIVPFDIDTLPPLPLTVRFNDDDKDFRTVIVSASKVGVWLGASSTAIPYSELLRDCVLFDSGKPFGIMEHQNENGEWVE